MILNNESTTNIIIISSVHTHTQYNEIKGDEQQKQGISTFLLAYWRYGQTIRSRTAVDDNDNIGKKMEKKIPEICTTLYERADDEEKIQTMLSYGEKLRWNGEGWL